MQFNLKAQLYKKNGLNMCFRIFVVVLSATIYSLSVVWFLEPANLLATGFTAISQVLNRLLNLIHINVPIGIFALILNIPVCVFGYKYVSHKFIIFTVLSVVIQSILLIGFIPTPSFVDNIKNDRLFLAIIAGLLSGAGIGIALRYGTSTGGVDVISQAINLRKGYSIGVISMMVNIVLAIIGGIIDKDPTTTLYTFIYIIIANLVVDKIHTAYNYLRIDVITSKKEEVSQALIDGIKRGCTIMDVQGAYTRVDKFDVFMVISSYELFRAKSIINEVDPQAFIMVLPVKRIIGAFFKHTII